MDSPPLPRAWEINRRILAIVRAPGSCGDALSAAGDRGRGPLWGRHALGPTAARPSSAVQPPPRRTLGRHAKDAEGSGQRGTRRRLRRCRWRRRRRLQRPLIAAAGVNRQPQRGGLHHRHPPSRPPLPASRGRAADAKDRGCRQPPAAVNAKVKTAALAANSETRAAADVVTTCPTAWSWSWRPRQRLSWRRKTLLLTPRQRRRRPPLPATTTSSPQPLRRCLRLHDRSRMCCRDCDLVFCCLDSSVRP